MLTASISHMLIGAISRGAMMTESLELYGTGSCPFTSELRQRLRGEGRPFVEYDVEKDPEAHARLVRITGRTMVPALIDRGSVLAVGWQGRGCLV